MTRTTDIFNHWVSQPVVKPCRPQKQIKKISRSIMNTVWHFPVSATLWTPQCGADSHFFWPNH